MKHLLAGAGAGCALTLHGAHAAEINGATSTPVATSTADAGAGGDITITEDGEIVLEASPGVVAVTLDSDNAVVIDGGVEIQNSDDAVGVLIEGGRTGRVSGEGYIIIDEDYDREDDDDDDDLDGPFALGFRRTGILLDGSGAFTGDIDLNAGFGFQIQGNESAGVRLQSLLDGSFYHDGSITVEGDGSFGVDIQDGVSGDFLLSGSVFARGEGAIGVSVMGDIGGALTVESSIVSTGFASTGLSNYADPDELEEDDETIEERIDAEDLNPNGPALAIGGSVGDGILVNGIIDDFIDDEEADDETKDTIEDFDENRSTGGVTSYGPGAALLISPDWDPAGSGDLIVGEVVETVRDTQDDDEDDDIEEMLATFAYDYGLINRGAISGNGLNVGYAAAGLAIEGAADGTRAAIIEGGAYNSGSITAYAYEANAVAFRIGDGASLSRLINDGAIDSDVYTETDDAAAALIVEAGGALSYLFNGGSITSSVRGYDGAATAIRDLSGTLAAIDNQGSISATFIADGEEPSGSGAAVALDLSANTSGVVITQTRATPVDDVNGDDDIDNDDVATPRIRGEVLLGSGADALLAYAGEIEGALDTGAGDDRFLASDTIVEADIEFGAGADLFELRNEAEFEGTIRDSDQDLRLIVENSTLALANAEPLVLDTLEISGESTLSITTDLSAPGVEDARLSALTSATIGAGATIDATLTGFNNLATTLTLIESAALTIDGGVATDIDVNAPAIFASAVNVDATRLTVSLTPKTAGDLGLDANASAAFDPFIAFASADANVGEDLTSYYDDGELVEGIESLLPFAEDAALRLVAGETSLASGPLAQRIDLLDSGAGLEGGFWLQESARYLIAKEDGVAHAYEGPSLSVQGGWDRRLGAHAFAGLSGLFATAKYKTDGDFFKESQAALLMIGPYGGLRAGALAFDASASYGSADLTSLRRVAFGSVNDLVSGDWSGTALSGSARLSYEAGGTRLYARPSLTLDYARLSQDAYEEVAAVSDNPYALAVGDSDTSRLASTALLTLGRRSGAVAATEAPTSGYGALGAYGDAAHWFQTVYGGYRVVIDETDYAATASFAEGTGETFDILDPRSGANALLFGFAFGMSNEAVALSLGYDGEIEGEVSSHRASVNFRLRF